MQQESGIVCTNSQVGVNSKKSIMALYTPVIKDNKKRLGDLMDPNDTASYRLKCGLQTMQAIDFLARSVQELGKRVLPADVTLLQVIDANCAKFYKDVLQHLPQYKTK